MDLQIKKGNNDKMNQKNHIIKLKYYYKLMKMKNKQN
jgi:hypothetical protein